ncbi:MAG TPA: hypothetical protein PKY59_11915 [Pyrinomonadaceae bacterium]|nr:hypothetical protein [Pyrinomonadaceae bacterium]
MEIAFEAIGIEIGNESLFNDLTENVGKRGEVSRLARKSGTLHGKCLKLGEGLEVWSVLYESANGELVFSDCRPAFRARFAQKITPWVLSEFTKDAENVIHGFLENSETEVLFELQNLTEVGTKIFERKVLNVGLCGLAYRAEIIENSDKKFWRAFDEVALNVISEENDWSLCGEVIAFEPLKNSFSGKDLFWIHLDIGEFKLEILVNQTAIAAEKLKVGAFLRADVWLQGHIFDEKAKRKLYEGVDWKVETVDFWKLFKKPN